MRQTALAVVAALTLVGCISYTGTMTAEESTMSEIVEVPGASQGVLFVLANAWAVDQFVKADSVIEFSDKEAGVIKGKCVLTSMSGGTGITVRSVLTLEVKDGRSRITIAAPHIKTLDGTFTQAVTSRTVYERYCIPAYTDLIASYRTALKKPPAW